MTEVKDSILQSTKKVLGIASDYTAFDIDIALHINSVLSTVQQVGVGLTDSQLEIEDETQTWTDLLTTQQNLVMVRSYIYLRVRQLFDPPASGFVTDSFDRQIKELEWRMSVAAETSPNVSDSTPPDNGGETIDPQDVADAVDAYLAANPVADGVLIQQDTPLSTWSFSHELNRVPVVSVYVDNEEVDADVSATSSTVVITFPSPTAGFVVLT